MSREEAISLLTQVNKILVNSNSWLENTHEPLNMAFDMAIKALEQEPKTGHWYRQTNDYVDYYECSECGMAMGLYDVKSYCPNCGSRNEVEK